MAMHAEYLKVAERLTAYRKKLDMTQAQMSRQFGVTQLHYGSLEAGKVIISYQGLKNFEAHGGDIYYLITGKHYQAGKMDEYMSRCLTEEGKMYLFRVMLDVFSIKNGVLEQSEGEISFTRRAYKSLQLVYGELQELPIWENIREIEKLTQVEMARRLDVNIKRYRRIEKGLVKPDAEILNTLYYTFEYSPLVITNQQLFYTEEMNLIWNTLPEAVRSKMEVIFENVLDLVNNNKDVAINETYTYTGR